MIGLPNDFSERSTKKSEPISADSAEASQWAPDGDRIAFVAKHHDANYLLEVNILTEKLTQYFKLDYDNISSPDYDGSGEQIVFSALKEGQTDLYSIELLTGEINRLTFDAFNDTHPSWHPTTDKIVYTSERGRKNRLVLIDLDNGTERVLTNGTYNAISPSWTPDGESILFCADGQGVYDIYQLTVTSNQLPERDSRNITPSFNSKLETRNSKLALTRLTSMMTGCFNPSLSPDGKQLLFSAYQNGKYDVHTMKIAKTIEEKVEVIDIAEPTAVLTTEKPETYRIARRKYSTKSSFALDAIFPDFTLGADGILRSAVQIIGSDMLGNHRIGVSVMSQSSYLAPDFIAQYGFLTHRTDIGAMVYNYHEYHILGGIQSRRGILQRITGTSARISITRLTGTIDSILTFQCIRSRSPLTSKQAVR